MTSICDQDRDQEDLNIDVSSIIFNRQEQEDITGARRYFRRKLKK